MTHTPSLEISSRHFSFRASSSSYRSPSHFVVEEERCSSSLVSVCGDGDAMEDWQEDH